MGIVLEQLQTRLTKVDELLELEYAKSEQIGVFKQTGDRQDRVTMQDLGSINARIKELEAERTSLQNQINRLSGAHRVQTRPVSTVRVR